VKTRPNFLKKLKEERKSLPATIKERLQTDPARFIRQRIRSFVRTSPDNRLSFLENYRIFGDPLVRFADGDAPIFTEYKSIISPNHLTPREALARAVDKRPEDLPSRLSVISWVLPIVEETRRSNRPETRVPSRLWSHTRWYGEKFNDKLRIYVENLLTGAGYLATAPMLQPFFKTYETDKGPYSNWSERHIAYAAGQGTFSLSDGFITERGIAHRCGSVVTSLALPASCGPAGDPYSHCLFYAGVECRSCMDRCPAGAISEKGHDKVKCQQHLRGIGYVPTQLNVYDIEKTIVGCGLCQTGVPCEFQNPTKKLKKK
jgi:epoxyqueuosine reductase